MQLQAEERGDGGRSGDKGREGVGIEGKIKSAHFLEEEKGGGWAAGADARGEEGVEAIGVAIRARHFVEQEKGGQELGRSDTRRRKGNGAREEEAGEGSFHAEASATRKKIFVRNFIR